MRSPFRRSTGGRRRGAPALGIAVLVILVPIIFTYYAFTRSLPLLTSAYTDYAEVSNSVNVRPGAPVRIAGVTVGSVTDVSRAQNGSRIAFTLDPSARPLHTDATVNVADRLFLEGAYAVNVDPGSPSAPVAPEGFTIRQTATQNPVQFFQLLSTFDSAARTDLQRLLDNSNIAFSPPPGRPESDSGAGALKQAIPALTPDMKDFAQISQALTGTHAGDVQRLLASGSDITATLSGHRYALADMFARLDTVAGTLAGEDDAIGRTIHGLDATLQVAPSALTALDRSLDPLDQLSAALTPTLRQSPPLLSALATQVGAVNRIVAPGQRQRLVGALRTLFVQFGTVARKLADFFPATGPSAACLATRVTPLLKEVVKDGALSTNDPVWKDLGHFLPTLASASGNYDANGPYLRALVGLGSNSVPSGLLGSLPGVGSLLGTVAGTSSSNSTVQGTAPAWVGDLVPQDFHPEKLCSASPLPTNLGANPAEAFR